MKRFLVFTLMVVIMFSLTIPVSAKAGITFFVALNGNDANDGSMNSPFATIEGAQKAIRALGAVPDGGIVVNLRGGEYRLTKTLNFAAEDSGREGAPIVYRSYPGEKAVLTGSVKLDSNNNFTPLSNAEMKKKIPADVQPFIKQMDLSGIDVDLGEFGNNEQGSWSELIVGGERANVAQYPNYALRGQKYLYSGSIIRVGAMPDQGTIWTCDDPILKELEGETTLFAQTFISYHWWSQLENVSVNYADKSITSEKPLNFQGVPKAAAAHPFYFINAPQLLDVPGEYYIDREAKTLYYYPEGPTESITAAITSFKGDFIKINKASNLIFQGITFQDGRSACFETRGCDGIIVDGCTIKNFASATGGLNFWESRNCQVINSEIRNIGGRGVNVEGGNAEQLIPCNFKMINNDISKLGYIASAQATAIWCHGYNGGTLGVYIAHNVFHDLPYGVKGGGYDVIFEYNEIYNCVTESADMAAVYTGGFFNNEIIRYNYIHDIPCNFENSGYGTNGIYIDVDGAGVEVYGNVIANVHRNMYYSSTGAYGEFYNNVLIGNPSSPAIKEMPASAQTIRIANYGVMQFEPGGLQSRLKPFMTGPLWLEKRPYVAKNLEIINPLTAAHLIERNIMYNCRDMAIAEETYDDPRTSIKDNWFGTTDPGFVDLANNNYQLRPDAPVFESIPGFEMIDMSKIGRLPQPVDINAPVGDDDSGSQTGTTAQPVSPSVDDKAWISQLGQGLALKVGAPTAVLGGKAVYIDASNKGVVPVIKDGRTLVPVRFIANAFGAQVGWKEETREVALVIGEKIVILQIDSNTLRTGDGQKTQIDVPAQVIEGRTFIPLRALSEIIGKQVFWDDKGIIILSDVEKSYSSDLVNYLDAYLVTAE